MAKELATQLVDKLGRRTDVDIAVHGDVLPTLAALMP